ncbi:MAG: hypothetical protein MUC91_14140 [Verrucomicrobia bacterium]|nr:hypothetical protein [Verrucomicrobiota bacterium]
MLKNLFAAALAIALLTGCNATFTNLTPKQQVRSPDGLYPVEVSLNTRRDTIRWDTMDPKIVVGEKSYPMRQTKLMKNRWEGLVPVPPGTNIVYYNYRFDFLYNDFGGPKRDNMVSDTYRLLILEE